MPDPVFYELADKLCKWSVCARCYSGLEKRPDPEHDGGWLVTCSRDSSHVGTVSRRTAEQKIAQGYSEKREVTRMLRRVGLLPDPLAGKSADDLRKELGY